MVIILRLLLRLVKHLLLLLMLLWPVHGTIWTSSVLLEYLLVRDALLLLNRGLGTRSQLIGSDIAIL